MEAVKKIVLLLLVHMAFFLEIKVKNQELVAAFQLELTFYTLTSVCIFSLPFAIHLLWHRQGEFVQQGRASFVSDYFFFSYDLNV